MKKLVLSLAACAAMLSASATGTWKLGPYDYAADTLFHVTAGPGITTTGVRLSSANGANQTNIFYSTIDLTNPNLELRGVQAKDGGGVKESVGAMGNRKNTQGNGHYVAGVNGDFFNMSGSPTVTLAHSIVDGKLQNSGSGGAGWQQFATHAMVEGAKNIRIENGLNAANMVSAPSGINFAYHVNGGRGADQLVIYTSDSTSTGTNVWGSECAMKLVSGSLADGVATFEITSTPTASGTGGNMTVEKDGYVLSGHGSAGAFVRDLKIGDQVTTSTVVSLNGKALDLRHAIGGCSFIVMNGKIAPDKYFAESVVDHFVSNQARTVIGYNEDRTKLILLVADKYTTSQFTTTDAEKQTYGPSSTGMVLQRMGHIMLHLGCYTAMNFDGGGSSQLYNEGRGVVNAPYGADYLRPVANGFFAVVNTPEEDTEIASIEVRQKNVNVAEGETFVPTVYGYNKYGVLVDKDVKGFNLTVAPSLGTSANGSRAGEASFTANASKGTTIAVVELPVTSTDATPVKCGVRLSTNGGGEYVTSGGDDLPIMVATTYEADEPMGVDKTPLFLTEQWSFNVDNPAGDWDGTAADWTSEDAIKSKACPRFATARNGRFYTVDMRSMSIAEITPEGELVPLYKLPSLEGRMFKGVVNGQPADVPDFYGTAISTDDAGNFLVGHLFTQTDTYRVWTIYDPRTNKAKHFEIEIPEGELSSGRIDQIGRVVGDLTKEAYVYVAPKATGVAASQKALAIAFKGDGNVENVNVTSALTPVYLAGNGNTLSICQPSYASVAEMAGKDYTKTFYCYSKAGGLGQWNQDLFGYENPAINYCNDWNNYSRLNGFDTFILGGKRYFVVHYSESAADNSGQHIIVMDEQSVRVAEWTGSTFTAKDSGYNSIVAVPSGESQVNIYVYNCTGAKMAGALLSLTLGDEYVAYEPQDITSSGYNFDNYADGDPFVIYSTENTGWSGPANFYKTTHPDAFEQNGQLTSLLYRGGPANLNCQENVESKIQPMVTVRKINDYIGQALVINEQYSPYASLYGWPGAGFSAYQPQFNFYIDNHNIKADTQKRHYVRVRLVYNVLMRGCHYAQDIAAGKNTDVVKSIYATHEGNWVVPENDYVFAGLYADSGIDFAKWVDETGLVEDIPAKPEVLVPADGDVEPLDPTHAEVSATHATSYFMNPERFRVYEFDTYMDDPSAATLSVQFNILDRNITYIIKEIKFTDLGTDEAAANLFRKRSLGWMYYNAQTTGIEDITTDAAVEGSDAPAVYYNLQGVQIKNPENGIYIVRRGNQVTKEYIR